MAKRVYSLVLSDEVVAEADRLARRLGTNRSGLVDRILAEYFSCELAENTVRDIFSAVEELLGAREVFRVNDNGTRLCLRSALDYKYNPTVRYSVELTSSGGVFRAYLRSQNALLLLYVNEFFRIWAALDGVGSSCGTDGSFCHRFSRGGESADRTAERIFEYVSALDEAMKCYLSLADNPAAAEARVRRIHANSASGGGI